MGDEESSSSRGAGSRDESVVIDHGRRRSTCGYCRSTTYTSISHGLWALSITANDYQELLDRGWRRSGSFLYKPEMEKTCCPSYTIRLKGGDFALSKEQIRVHRKVQRFLDGTLDARKPDQLKGKLDSTKGPIYLAGDSSTTKLDESIHYLSKKIDDAIGACIGTGEFPPVQLPKAVVKSVTKKKLLEASGDLSYTSNIAFQIAAALRKLLVDVTPNMIAEKLACSISQHGEPSGMLVRACNGHLNFYSTTKQASSAISTTDSCKQTSKGSGSKKETLLPQRRRKLEMHMKRSNFDPEEFALYKKYQIKVHGDKPEKVTESSYRRFLVDSPIIFIPPSSGDNATPPCGFGSFHQQYVIDGKLVAVGVVDILPACLSSKYLFWDPDFAFLSLGKYSALQEINWVNEARFHCPSLQYYYLGYYIHSCSKMRYKAAYRPSELLCPLRYKWVPFDNARPLLDKKPYVALSDFTAGDYQESLSQVPGTTGQPGCHLDCDGMDESSCDDDDEKTDLDYEVSDMCLDDELELEASSASIVDNPEASDISNIVMDLKGSRVTFKGLQQVFGPIDKEHVLELEMQMRRYVKVVGPELSDRMVYSLG